MTELLAFAERHPWWTLFYLALICGALNGIFRISIGRKA
jgi:hypothetical protein